MKQTSNDLTHIRPNWWVVLPVCALLMLCAILVVMVITVPAVRAGATQRPFNSGTMSWRSIILWDVGMVGAALWLCWQILKQALTRFTTEGVTQPRLIGAVHIGWSDVEWVSPGLTIGSSTAKIAVSPHAFRNPEEVRQVVTQRVPQRTPVVEQP